MQEYRVMDGSLLRISTLAATRARLTHAIEAGHRVVLLLAEPAGLATALLEAAVSDLVTAGRFVHTPGPGRLGPDLDQPDPRVVVAFDAIDALPRPALLALDAHLRTAGTQLLLAGPPACRALTAAAGLQALHASPFLITVPPLPAAEAADFLRLHGTRPAACLLRAASGEPRLLARLGRRRLARLFCASEWPPLAALLDRPVALLGPAFCLALAAFGLSVPLEPPAHRRVTAVVVTPPILPPIAPPAVPASPYAVTLGAPSNAGGTDDGVTVDREEPDVLSPRRVTARRGETLRSMYARIYRGLTPPPFAVVRALNPRSAKPGMTIVFPPPDEGWPSP